MRTLQRPGDLDAELEDRLNRQGMARQRVAERGPFEQLEDDEWLAVVLAAFVDDADVGMGETGGGARFAPQPGDGVRVAGDVGRQELDRHTTAELVVHCLVDHSHAATAHLAGYPVVRNGLIDHWVCTGFPPGGAILHPELIPDAT